MDKRPEWQRVPPYAVEEASMPWKAKYHGQCFCGGIKFELSDDPLDAKCCHCTTCQRLHGAPMQWAAVFRKKHVLFTEDSLKNFFHYNMHEKTAERKLPCKLSCAVCKAPIADEGRNMMMMFPPLIHFDRNDIPKAFLPTHHIFYGQNLLPVHDGVKKWEGHKEQSKEITEE